jgi:FtsH-binding integral membrane protein
MTPQDLPSAPSPALPGVAADSRVAPFLRAVYGWMCLGLGITAATAYAVASSPAVLTAIATNRVLFWALIIAQLGLVIVLSARVQKLSPGVASLLFLLYSGLTGVTFAFVLLAFTGQSIANVFVVTAGMFGALALYGTTTKRELAGLGQFAMMGLVGVVIASIIGIFWHNDTFQFVLSVCGVVAFTALTAWDAKRLRALALALPEGGTGSYAIVGALSLYLDFINLFLFLLRLFGRRR